jgi:hypothetical protein
MNEPGLTLSLRVPMDAALIAVRRRRPGARRHGRALPEFQSAAGQRLTRRPIDAGAGLATRRSARLTSHAVLRLASHRPHDRAAELVTQDAIAEIAAAAEQVGFGCLLRDGSSVSPHRWLYGGGHHALDPFVALSFAAAITPAARAAQPGPAAMQPVSRREGDREPDVLSGGRVIEPPRAIQVNCRAGRGLRRTPEVSTIIRASRQPAGDDVRFEDGAIRRAATESASGACNGRIRRSGSAATAR